MYAFLLNDDADVYRTGICDYSAAQHIFNLDYQYSSPPCILNRPRLGFIRTVTIVSAMTQAMLTFGHEAIGPELNLGA